MTKEYLRGQPAPRVSHTLGKRYMPDPLALAVPVCAHLEPHPCRGVNHHTQLPPDTFKNPAHRGAKSPVWDGGISFTRQPGPCGKGSAREEGKQAGWHMLWKLHPLAFSLGNSCGPLREKPDLNQKAHFPCAFRHSATCSRSAQVPTLHLRPTTMRLETAGFL